MKENGEFHMIYRLNIAMLSLSYSMIIMIWQHSLNI